MATVDGLKIERNGKPIDLSNLWAPNPAFLLGTGPSLAMHDLSRLRERGVSSFAVNNAAAFAPVRAWCFSDPQWKFHQDLFLDPAMITFAPTPKLKRGLVAKIDGQFRRTTVRVRNCPNVFGFGRISRFVPEEFFDDPHAHWGAGKDQPKSVPLPGSLCTIFLGLRILHHLGVKTVYLLGVDHKKRDRFAYGYPTTKMHRKGFWKEKKMWKVLLPTCEKRGVELYDAGGMCDLFPRVPFDDAVEKCKGSVGEEPLDTVGWNDKKLVVEQCGRNPLMKPIWH